MNFRLLLFSCSIMPSSLRPIGLQHTRLPVLHYLQEFAQTHVHWVVDAIQSSHPLSLPPSYALNLSQHRGLFQWVGSLHQMAKVLELQHQSFQWIFRIDWFDLLVVQGTLKSLLQHYSLRVSVLQVLSLLYGPAFTSVHDCGKTHSFVYTDLLLAKWYLFFLMCCLGLS